MVKNILVVDDEPKILEVVAALLTSKGYGVFTAQTAKETFVFFETKNISLILLDLMLPDMAGEEICTIIRKQSRIPIIMLTAKVEEENMLQGLDIGADDYITKPFSLKVLSARVEAVLRRSSDNLSPLYNKITFNNGDLSINLKSRLIKKQGELIDLTPNEFKIFQVFIKYPNKVFTREELIEIIFGHEYQGYDRSIDTHIKNLRQKIESNPRNPVYIKTIHGVGYGLGEIE